MAQTHGRHSLGNATEKSTHRFYNPRYHTNDIHSRFYSKITTNKRNMHNNLCAQCCAIAERTLSDVYVSMQSIQYCNIAIDTCHTWTSSDITWCNIISVPFKVDFTPPWGHKGGRVLNPVGPFGNEQKNSEKNGKWVKQKCHTPMREEASRPAVIKIDDDSIHKSGFLVKPLLAQLQPPPPQQVMFAPHCTAKHASMQSLLA